MKTDNNVRYIHRQIELFAIDGKIIVDATCGNGNDTLYLASKYPNSKVYGFDIQSQAINKTKERCAHLENVILIEDSHANVSTHINDEVNLAIFNLGYLPNADKYITTRAESTIAAIEALQLMMVSGSAIIITLYRGETNLAETKIVHEYLKTINKDFFIVSQYDLINLTGNPYNVIIECK